MHLTREMAPIYAMKRKYRSTQPSFLDSKPMNLSDLRFVPTVTIAVLGGILSEISPPKWLRLLFVFVFIILGLATLVIMHVESLHTQAVEKRNQEQQDIIVTLEKRNQEQQDYIITLLENVSRSGVTREDLINLWGKMPAARSYVTSMSGGAVSGGSSLMKGVHKRIIDVEKLGYALRESHSSAAVIINDGTNESRDFTKQLEIGLRKGRWQVNGDNFADPEFFSNSLTIEVSSSPASADDHSSQEAKILLETLKTEFHIEGVLRPIDLKFPPNFMRIKVAENVQR